MVRSKGGAKEQEQQSLESLEKCDNSTTDLLMKNKQMKIIPVLNRILLLQIFSNHLSNKNQILT